MSEPFDFDTFVAECETALPHDDRVEKIRSAVASAIANPEALTAALPDFSGDEELLYASDHMVVVHLRMTPNVHYPPHNHNMPVVVGIYAGAERSHSYERSDKGLSETGRFDNSAGDVVVLEDDAIHSVANIGADYSYALHVYVGDLIHQDRNIWQPQTHAAYPYSDETYFEFAQAYDDTKPFARPTVCYAHGSTK